jgi:hypothetical protein
MVWNVGTGTVVSLENLNCVQLMRSWKVGLLVFLFLFGWSVFNWLTCTG